MPVVTGDGSEKKKLIQEREQRFKALYKALDSLAVIAHSGDPRFGGEPISEIQLLKQSESSPSRSPTLGGRRVGNAAQQATVTPRVKCHNDTYVPPARSSPSDPRRFVRPDVPARTAYDVPKPASAPHGVRSKYHSLFHDEEGGPPAASHLWPEKGDRRRTTELRMHAEEVKDMKHHPNHARDWRHLDFRKPTRKVAPGFVPACARSKYADPRSEMSPRRVVEAERNERLTKMSPR
jgi:hypothetical protein